MIQKFIDNKTSNFSVLRKICSAFVLLALLGFYQTAHAQILITNGTVTTCSDVFQDDGGVGSYAVGQSYTFTICPDTPGDVISVQFNAFSLYQSPNPNNSDYLSIFDGDNPGEATLGNYTGNALQGLPVTGTVMNTTGCLTFVFSSNPNGGGTFPGWEGTISCTTPCDNPTAASELIDPIPEGPEAAVGVCLGDPVTFGDNGSFPAAGFDIEYWVWNFDDGTIDTLETASDISHSFEEPGEYLVNLSVIDDNGCRSLNLEPLQVLVSTIPVFNTNFNSPVCVGNPTSLDGNPIQSITWTALPPQVVAGETYLADGAGFSYSTSLLFDFFEPDAVLESCDDFLNVFVNMEHSYLGDLGFSLTCPNGTTVNMLTFATNTGGGTYLGEPVDDGFGDILDQGTGYNYGWSPTSTNGVIHDDANETNTTYVNNAGVEVTANIVNPGFYESEEDLCAFVGCPLNGEWTFSVSDNLGADNGYIFQWGINFDPSLFPDVTTFTPVIGLQADSSYWEGPDIVNTSDDGNSIDVLLNTPGTYNYTYFATNNFGCTFDTTVVVEAIEGPDITAGPDQTYCEDPVQLQASVVGDNPPSCDASSGDYTYCLENGEEVIVTYCPDNPGDGSTYMSLEFLGGDFGFGDDIIVYDGDDITAPQLFNAPFFFPLAGETATASVDNPTGCLTLQITSNGFGSCEDTGLLPIEVQVTCGPPGNLVWSWSPADGLSDPNISNPTAVVSQATVYTVTAFPEGLPGCVITDQVTVSPDALADPGLNTDTVLCYNSPQSILTDYLDGNPAPGGVWVDLATGEELNSLFDPTQYTDGGTFNYQYTVGNAFCTNESFLNITILGATNDICCQTNAQAGPDDVACGLVYELSASVALGTGTWSGPPEVSFSDPNDPNATVTCASPGGSITLTWTDNNGDLCQASDDIIIEFSDPLSLIVVPEEAACFNTCTGTAIAIADGGTAPGGSYSFEWYENGVPGFLPSFRDSICAGIYQVKVLDNFGCEDSISFEITEPEPQSILVQSSPALCSYTCDGRVTIESPNASSYSFDGGETFVNSNTSLLCPGEYMIVARNDNGCEISEPVSINQPEEYVANFNINPNPTTTKNTIITFQDISRPGPVIASEYTFGENPVIGESSQRISNFRFPTDTSGIYPVELISTNFNNCKDTVVKFVDIKDDLLWFIPNSFTPNQDGINEIWRPIGNTVDFDDYRLGIYDRWGEEVFFTTDFDEGWDGSKSGGDFFVQAGVYSYVIKMTSLTTDEKYELTGFITVVR